MTHPNIPEEVKQRIENELKKYIERLRISSASVDMLRDRDRALGFQKGAAIGYSLCLESTCKELAEALDGLLKVIPSDPDFDEACAAARTALDKFNNIKKESNG